LAFMALIITFSCNNNKQDSSNNVDSKKTENKQDKKSTSSRIIKAHGVEIPVYDENSYKHLLNKKDDKIHVINYWATWCKPCVDELPDFEKLRETHSDKGVEILMVSIDYENFDTKLPEFVQQNMKNKVILVDYKDEVKFINGVDKSFNGAIPVTIIYDKHKRYFINGATNYEELVEQIEKFRL